MDTTSKVRPYLERLADDQSGFIGLKTEHGRCARGGGADVLPGGIDGCLDPFPKALQKVGPAERKAWSHQRYGKPDDDYVIAGSRSREGIASALSGSDALCEGVGPGGGGAKGTENRLSFSFSFSPLFFKIFVFVEQGRLGVSTRQVTES